MFESLAGDRDDRPALRRSRRERGPAPRTSARSPPTRSATRPPVCEATAIAAIAAIAKEADARIHIAHVTCARARSAPSAARGCAGRDAHRRDVPAVPRARIGARSRARRRRQGRLRRCASPRTRRRSGTAARRRHDRRSWRATTRRSSSTRRRMPTTPRRRRASRPSSCWCPSCSTRAARGVFSLERAVDCSRRPPARLFGLYPEKGVIAVGLRRRPGARRLDDTFASVAGDAAVEGRRLRGRLRGHELPGRGRDDDRRTEGSSTLSAKSSPARRAASSAGRSLSALEAVMTTVAPDDQRSRGLGPVTTPTLVESVARGDPRVDPLRALRPGRPPRRGRARARAARQPRADPRGARRCSARTASSCTSRGAGSSCRASRRA